MKIYRDEKDQDRIQGFLNKALENRPYQIFPLAGDASARRYYRVVVDDKSQVLMVWAPFENEEEFPFLSVQRLLNLCGVHVPEVLLVDSKLGLFLLEDLGDLTLERKFWENQDQALIEPFYQLALDEVLKIHFTTAKAQVPCPAFEIRFDTAKLEWELNYAREHLIEGLLKAKLTPAQDKIFKDQSKKICSYLSGLSPVVCHRDYHSRNIMVKHGKVWIIDFQDARLGPPAYDLVSLLRDSYVNIEEELEGRLLKYYLEGAKAKGHNLSPDQFFDSYEVQTIQRCLKACGSFASFFNTKGDTRYLKYLGPTLLRVQNSLEASPLGGELHAVLEDLGLFDASFESQ